ncbi:hypothetical protein AB4Y64_14000 [Lysobacter sp. TAF61]|uniref:hypothetical protein n=1 Tax=Lysobacter sp. TAF61 TaxID=3233072 RepID=UPI003F954DF4
MKLFLSCVLLAAVAAAHAGEDGPWRLVAPGESRPARWVRQVDSIRVVDAP